MIYFHSSRLDQLSQTVRFLERREPDLLAGELVLVCQDTCARINTRFESYQHHDLRMSTYHKSYMCNFGVKIATHNCVAILDSDRILPHGYFTRNMNGLGSRQVVSTIPLYKLRQSYSDEQLEAGSLDIEPDFRSPTNEAWRKNLFCGNTLMRRDDYLSIGGMDENFVGYGFADHDMTRTVMSANFDIRYLQETELHLYHPQEIVWLGGHLDQSVFRIVSAINAIRYYTKWKSLPSEWTKEVFRMVERDLSRYPAALQQEYLSMKQTFDRRLKLL